MYGSFYEYEEVDLVSRINRTLDVMIKKRKRRTPKEGLDVVHFCHDRMFMMSAKFPITTSLEKYFQIEKRSRINWTSDCSFKNNEKDYTINWVEVDLSSMNREKEYNYKKGLIVQWLEVDLVSNYLLSIEKRNIFTSAKLQKIETLIGNFSDPNSGH
ncbi:uncharacterized protein OCT59_012814 [Rhizophagus irregularis]|uniref:uncharacterized protein n=1 Tax=Rhizophagus irregularis TaxID=588596 RepID=UPI00333204C3|nr:hypothetical protein OCT59_012814 [Rhizophagus irregularis]